MPVIEGGFGGGGTGGNAGGGNGGAGGSPPKQPSLLFKLVDSAPTYTAELTQISGSELSSTALAFGTQGFVITAATTNTAGYTVWGFQPEAATAP